MKLKAQIRAIATYLPEKVLSNNELERENPTWNMKSVAERAGVINRHIAAEDETAYDLAKRACERLFSQVDQKQCAIDGLIFCTQSPDYIMPPNSHLLHRELGLPDNVMAFDFNLACSGYIYGLAMASSFIASGQCRSILLVTADTYSKYINRKDRATRGLFGDGAAVTWIEAVGDDSPGGFLPFTLASHGKEYDKFYIPVGGLRRPKSAETARESTDRSGNIKCAENIQMDGLAVWTFINSAVPRQIQNYLQEQKLSLSQIDQFIFHQASRMTLDSLIKVLGIGSERVFMNLAQVGNTVSASIPIALADAIRLGRIRVGQKILLSGFGVGLSYGTTVLRYESEIHVY